MAVTTGRNATLTIGDEIYEITLFNLNFDLPDSQYVRLSLDRIVIAQSSDVIERIEKQTGRRIILD